MEKKHQVHNLIILDESGSMGSIKNLIIQGFNELVQTIQGVEKNFPEQEHFISMISFNGLGQKILHFVDPAEKLKKINYENYIPDASTPLYDAMGYGMNKLNQYLEGKTDYNVLVTILTDGEENASKEFKGKDIKKMVEDLKNSQWTFTYIGTDHNVEDFARGLSINNTMAFNKDPEGIKRMFSTEESARLMFSQKIRDKKDTSEGYYKDLAESGNKE